MMNKKMKKLKKYEHYEMVDFNLIELHAHDYKLKWLQVQKLASS